LNSLVVINTIAKKICIVLHILPFNNLDNLLQ